MSQTFSYTFSGVEKLVPKLYKAGIPLAVATSASMEGFEKKTSRHKDFFNKYFSHVVAAGSDPSVKEGKPAPDVFLVCAARFSDSPEPSKVRHCFIRIYVNINDIIISVSFSFTECILLLL